MSAIAVAAGTISLKKVMALLVFANTFTPPENDQEYATTSAAEIISRHGQLALPVGGVQVQLLRPGPGPGLMYSPTPRPLRVSRDDGNPGRQAGDEPHQRPVGVVAVATGAADSGNIAPISA